MFSGKYLPSNQLIYQIDKENLPQTGPLCYYYTILRCLTIQGNNLDSLCIPSPVLKITEKIRELSSAASDDLDDLIDDIFKTYLNEELLSSIPIDDEDSFISLIDNIMENYSHTQTMALLCGLSINKNHSLDTLSIENYFDLLIKHGPIIIDGEFGLNNYDMKNISTIFISGKTHAYHSVNVEKYNGQHCILLIGCQTYPTQKMFYLDPNFPNIIQTINFKCFIKNIYNYSDRLIYNPAHQVKPNYHFSLHDFNETAATTNVQFDNLKLTNNGITTDLTSRSRKNSR
jgi:hypothetical protein